MTKKKVDFITIYSIFICTVIIVTALIELLTPAEMTSYMLVELILLLLPMAARFIQSKRANKHD